MERLRRCRKSASRGKLRFESKKFLARRAISSCKFPLMWRYFLVCTPAICQRYVRPQKRKEQIKARRGEWDQVALLFCGCKCELGPSGCYSSIICWRELWRTYNGNKMPAGKLLRFAEAFAWIKFNCAPRWWSRLPRESHCENNAAGNDVALRWKGSITAEHWIHFSARRERPH